MWVTRYKVNCGRNRNDWLRWVDAAQVNENGAFCGDEQKRKATAFLTEKQAGGAIKQHKKVWGTSAGNKHTIHAVRVQVKKEKKPVARQGILR